jgi:phosphohistidine swiveling domain-containing protein
MPTKVLEGTTVCGGVVTGNVRVVTDPRDAAGVQPGEILVVPCSHPEYALGVLQAAGLICEQGGIISHICTVALELGIPCVTEVKDATRALATLDAVTLDADQGAVYAA